MTAALLLGTALSAPAGKAEILVVAPRDGALLDTPGITLSGTVGEGSSVSIAVNDAPGRAVPARGGVFSFPVDLREGENSVTLSAGGESRRAAFRYRPAGGPGTYRFHPGYEEGECDECHLPLGRGGRQSDLCHSCHDSREDAPYLHGPVGAGQCTSCHDPHGSANGAFLTSAGKGLCHGCHDQPSSAQHMQAASGRGCTQCHDPHGSGKKFFLE